MENENKKVNLKKEYFWNTIGSGAASFISLIYLIIVTRINDTDVAGAFTLSFSNACMLYAIALYSGRTYQVTELNKSVTDNDFLFQRLICSFITIIMTMVVAFVYRYSGLKLILLMLLSLSKIIEAISDVYHGYMQKNNRLDIVGKSLLLRTLMSTVLFTLIEILFKNIVLATSIIIITNLITLLFIDVKYGRKYKEKSKVKKSSIRHIFIFGFFTFSITLISNFLYNIPRYGIDRYLNDNLQAIYGIIVMPATIIMVINQFVIQPLITVLKDSYEKKNKKQFLMYIKKIITITILVGIVSIIAGYFCGIPVLELLYGIKLSKYLISFLIIILGACLYTIATVFSNSLIVIRKTKIQFYIYLSVTFVSYVISDLIIKRYGFTGAVYSYLIMMMVLLILYIVSFITIINKKEIWEEIKNGRKNK